MLFMRNFGYLGLHSAIHASSTLARSRVVDFTGDLQVRRRYSDETCDLNDNDSRVCVAPSWHTDFVGEPTVNGGRNPFGTDKHLESRKNKSNNPAYYVQEVAPLPLSITQPATRSTRIPGGTANAANDLASSRGSDAELYFYTSLCNEFICQPRILHQLGCVKRNVTIKIEVRRLKFCERLHSFIATLPRSGPSLHNTRRGSFLVNELFTACAYHCLDPHFLDEFKIKLPFMYSGSSSEGKLVALFYVYNVSVKEKKRRFFRRNHEVHAEDTSDDGTERKSAMSPLELLGCGYLPLFTDGDVPCLISNGLHDVKLKYMPKPLLSPIDNAMSVTPGKSDYEPDTLILEPLSSTQSEKDATPRSGQPSPAHSKNIGFWRSDSGSVSVEECINTIAPKHLTSQHSLEDDSSDSIPFNCFTTSDPILSSNYRTGSPSPVSSIADSVSSRWTKDRESFTQSTVAPRSRKGSEAMVLQESIFYVIYRDSDLLLRASLSNDQIFTLVTFVKNPILSLTGSNSCLIFSSPSKHGTCTIL